MTELNEKERQMLDALLGSIMPQLDPRQRAISKELTKVFNDELTDITKMSRAFDEIAGFHPTVVVAGAALQLVLNAINAVAEGTLVNADGEHEDVPIKELRNDVAAAFCDIIRATIASDQGLD